MIIKKKKLPKEPPIPCKLIHINNTNGEDWDCEYGTGILCEDCIINGGEIDPRTDKKYKGKKIR